MKKLLLYISAFVPLYVLLIVKILVQIAFNNLHFNVLNSLTLAVLTLLTLLGGIGLAINLKVSSKHQNIQILNVQNITEQHFLGYFSLFVLFALGYQIEYVSMAVVFALILVFIGVVYIRNNLFYINPLLNLIGFSFYRISYTILGSEQQASCTIIYFGKLKKDAIVSAHLTDYNFNTICKK